MENSFNEANLPKDDALQVKTLLTNPQQDVEGFSSLSQEPPAKEKPKAGAGKTVGKVKPVSLPPEKAGALDNFGVGIKGPRVGGKESLFEFDYESYAPYFGNNMGTYYPGDKQALDTARAHTQTGVEQFKNASVRVAKNIIPEVVAQLANVVDLEDYANSDAEVGNWLSTYMKEVQDGVNLDNPIYRENPGQALDVGDSAWWFENGASLVTSAGGFVATGYLTGGLAGSLAGKLGQGAKWASSLGKTSQLMSGEAGLARGAGAVMNAIVLNQAEGVGIGVDTFKQVYENQLAQLKAQKGNVNQSDEALEKIARQRAADAATSAINFNRMNILFNLTSAAAFLKTPKGSRDLISPTNWKSSLLGLVGEGGQESAEELINNISQEQAKDSKYSFTKALESAMSAEGQEAMLLGFIGGAGQTALTKAGKYIPMYNNRDYNKAYNDAYNKIDESVAPEERSAMATRTATEQVGKNGMISQKAIDKRRYAKQQEMLLNNEKQGTVDRVSDITSAYVSAEENIRILESINEAQSKGDLNKVEELNNQLFSNQALNNFEIGTTQSFIDLHKGYGELSAEEAEAKGLPKDYKKLVADRVKQIETLETIYNNSKQYINSSDVYQLEEKKLMVTEKLNENLETIKEAIKKAETTYHEGHPKAIGKDKAYVDSESPSGYNLNKVNPAFKKTKHYTDLRKLLKIDTELRSTLYNNNKEEGLGIQPILDIITSSDYQSDLKQTIKENQRKAKKEKINKIAAEVRSKATDKVQSTIASLKNSITPDVADTTVKPEVIKPGKVDSSVETTKVESKPASVEITGTKPKSPILVDFPMFGNPAINAAFQQDKAVIENPTNSLETTYALLVDKINTLEQGKEQFKVFSPLEANSFENLIANLKQAKIEVEQQLETIIDANDLLQEKKANFIERLKGNKTEEDNTDTETEVSSSPADKPDYAKNLQQAQELAELLSEMYENGEDTSDFKLMVLSFEGATDRASILQVFNQLKNLYNLVNKTNVEGTYEELILTNGEKQELLDKYGKLELLNYVDSYTSETDDITNMQLEIIEQLLELNKIDPSIRTVNTEIYNETGSDKLAYLAKKYNLAFEEHVTDKGRKYIAITKKDRDEFLNSMLDDKVLNPDFIKVGDTITFVPLASVALEDGTVRDASEVDDDSKPIGIQINGEVIEGLYLHDVTWLNALNLDNTKEGIELDQEKLRVLRHKILTSKELISTVITEKTAGVPIMNNDASINTVLAAMPKVEIGISRGGKIMSNRNNSLDVINPASIKEGVGVIAIPFNGKKLALPVRRQLLQMNQLDTLISAMDLYLNGVENATTKELQSLYGINILDSKGIEQYFNMFINLNKLPVRTKQDLLERTKTIKDNVPVIQFSNGNLLYSWGKGLEINDVYKTKNKGEDRQADLKHLRNFLKRLYSHVNLDLLEANNPVPYILDNGETHAPFKTYDEFVKDNMVTPYLSMTLKDGTVVYTIQGKIKYDIDSILLPIIKEASVNQSTEVPAVQSKSKVLPNGQVYNSANVTDFTLSPSSYSVKEINNSSVDFIFEQAPSLLSIGTKEQYFKYLNSIFPFSQLQDIVFRVDKRKDLTEETTVDDKTLSTKTGVFYSSLLSYAKSYNNKLEGRIYPTILDIRSGLIVDKEDIQYYGRNAEIFLKHEPNSDALVHIVNHTNEEDAASLDIYGDVGIEYVIFNPSQIHILGSDLDILGFKRYVNTKQKQDKNNQDLIEASSIIKGISIETQQTLFKSIANDIYTELQSDNAVEKSTVEVTKFTKLAIESLDLIVETAVEEENPYVDLIRNAVEVLKQNKAKIHAGVRTELNKKVNLSKLDTYATDGGEDAIVIDTDEMSERNVWLDTLAFTIDPKTSLSKEVKSFLEGIREKVVDTSSPTGYRDRLNLLNLPTYIPFDVVFNDLLKVMSRNNNNNRIITVNDIAETKYGEQPAYINNILRLIDEEVETKPYLLDVISKLKNAEVSVQNSFISALNKTHTNHVYLQSTYNTKSKSYSIRSNKSASRNVSNLVLSEWQLNLKQNKFLTTNEEGKVLVVKEQLALFNSMYDAMVEKGDNVSYTDLKSWLDLIGVDFHPSVFNLINVKGLKSGDIRFNIPQSLSMSTGIFKNIYERVNKFNPEFSNINSLEEEHLIEDKSFKILAQLTTNFRANLFTDSFKNSNGDTIYGYTNNRYFTDRFAALKGDVSKLQDLMSDPFITNSLWLNKLLVQTNEGPRINVDSLLYDKLEYGTSDGFKIKNNAIGKVIDSLNEGDFLKYNFGLYMNNGLSVGKEASATPIMKVLYPTMSDKANTFTLQADRKQYTLVNGALSKKDKKDLIDILFMPEINRIHTFNNNPTRVNNAAYRKGAGKFLLFPDLNAELELWGEDGKLLPGVGTDLQYDAILNKVLHSVINEEYKTLESNFNKHGLIAKDKIVYIDADFSKKFSKGNTTETLINYAINTMVANMNIQQLFIGDPVHYYAQKGLDKANRKLNELYAKKNKTKKDLADITELETVTIPYETQYGSVVETMDNMGKRLAGDNAGKDQYTHNPDDSFNVLVVRDNKGTSSNYDKLVELFGEEYAKGYKDINLTDAQEYTTLAEHLKLMLGAGKITKAVHDRVLETYNRTGKVSDSDVKVIVGPTKPVYVNNYNRDGINTRVYIKSSSFPLIKQFTEGRPIDALRQFMEDNGIDRLAHESAIKVGAPATTINIYNKGGISIPENWKDSLLENIPREGHGNQQEVPYDENKSSVNDGTQQAKLLFTNLLNVDGFINPFTGEQVNGRELADEYLSLYASLFKGKYEALIKELDYDVNTGTIRKLDKLKKILVKEGLSRNYSINDIASFTLNDLGTKFETELWLNTADSKIVSLLNSIVDNRVRKRKFRGKSFVLASDSNLQLQTINSIDTNNVIKIGDWDGKLKTITKDGQLTYAEVLIPFKFWDNNGKALSIDKFTTTDAEGNTILDLTKLPEKALEIFGYRIPTSGINLLATIKVVGFLPTTMGDLVIAPSEFIVAMGSDFDVDKLYTHMYNTHYSSVKDNEGNTIFSKLEVLDDNVLARYNTVLGRLNNAKKELAKLSKNGVSSIENNKLIKATEAKIALLEQADLMQIEDINDMLIQNKLLDIHKAVLNNQAKEVQYAKNRELSFGMLPELAMQFGKEAQRKGTSLLRTSYQQYKYQSARAGKTAVGVFSLDMVFNSVLQYVNTPLNFVNNQNEVISYNVFGQESTALNSEKTSTGKYKSEVIEGFMTAALDNEKEQLLGKLNINNETFHFIRAMFQLGFDQDVIIGVINQPSIFNYIEKTNRKEKVELRPFSKKERDNILFEISVDNLVEFSKVNNPSTLEQQAILDFFLELKEKGQQLKVVQSTINSDSSGIGKNMFYSMEKAKQIAHLPFKTSIPNIELVIGNYTDKPKELKDVKSLEEEGYVTYGDMMIKPTSIGGFAGVYATIFNNQLWRSLYPYTNDIMLDITTFNSIGRNDLRDTISANADLLQESTTSYKSLLSSSQYKTFSNYASVGEARKDLLFDTETHMSLGSIIHDIKLKGKYNNGFLTRLHIGRGTAGVELSGKLPTSISYYNALTLEMDEEVIIKNIIQMIVEPTVVGNYNGKDLTSKDLLDMLITHQIITGGIQKSGQFLKYIPYLYLKQNNYYNNITNLSDSVLTEDNSTKFKRILRTQNIQHNPEAYYDSSIENKDIKIVDKIAYVSPLIKKKSNGFIIYKDSDVAYRIFKYHNGLKQFIQIDNLGWKGDKEYDFDAEFAGESNVWINQNRYELKGQTAITVLENKEIKTSNATIEPNAAIIAKESYIDNGYNYYGAGYTILVEDGKGVDVVSYKGKDVNKQKLLNAYNTNPNVDPQNNKAFRGEVVQEEINVVIKEEILKPTSVSGIVYNAEQKQVISAGKSFIQSGNPSEWFTIEGKAGTGKTTIASEIVRGEQGVLVMALSHKAKNVIATKFKQDKVLATYASIAGGLGLKLDEENGTFVKDTMENYPAIKKANIILIDEASMINEDILAEIMKEKKKNAKVIFLGDLGQLPPIRADKNISGDTPAPAFNTKNISKLYTRVRQGEGNPILPFADNYWNYSQNVKGEIVNRENIINKEGGIVFVNNVTDIESTIIETFRQAIDTKNSNLLKVVAYRNNTKQKINELVHNSIFGTDTFEEGELIIFNNSYENPAGISIENSTETEILSINEVATDFYGIDFIEMDINWGDGLGIRVVHPAFKVKYNKVISDLFAEAKALKGTNRDAYLSTLRRAWSYKNLYADIDYGYAITSHKSQGSTYDMVIVEEQDIMSVGPLSLKSKAQSIYTGLTRAKHLAVVVSRVEVKDVEIDLLATKNQIESAKSSVSPTSEAIPTQAEITNFLNIDRDTTSDSSPLEYNTNKDNVAKQYHLMDNNLAIKDKYDLILKKIKDSSTNPITSYFADKLLDVTGYLSDTPLYVDLLLNAKGEARSLKSTKQPVQIAINPNNIKTEEDMQNVLIEEITHSILKRNLNSEAGKSIRSLYEDVKQLAINKYGQSSYDEMVNRLEKGLPLRQGVELSILYSVYNVDEFVAAAIKDSTFQKFLNTTETTLTSKSLWSKFVKLVSDLLVSLGVKKDSNLEAVLHEVIQQFESINKETIKNVSTPKYVRTIEYLNERFRLVDPDTNSSSIKGNPNEIADFINENIVNVSAVVDNGTVKLESNLLKEMSSDKSVSSFNLFEEDDSDTYNTISANFINYVKTLDIRTNQLASAITKAKAADDFTKVAQLTEILNKTKRDKALIKEVKSVTDLADRANQDLQMVDNILNRAMSAEDMVYTRNVVDFWKNAKEQVFDDRLYHSDILLEEYGKIEGIAKIASDKLDSIEKEYLTSFVKKQLGKDVDLDKVFEEYVDINMIQGNVRDISMYDNSLLTAIWASVKRANIEAMSEAESIIEDVDEQLKRVIPILKSLGRKDIFDVFRQRTAKGLNTNHIVNPFTKEYYTAYNKAKAGVYQNNDNLSLITYNKWVRENGIATDIKAIFPADGIETEEGKLAKSRLKLQLGEGTYNYWYKNQELKLKRYQDNKDGYLQHLLIEFNVADLAELEANKEALTKYNMWLDYNSPYKLEDVIFKNGKLRGGTTYNNFKYFEVIPKNPIYVDNNFKVIESNPDLLKFYNTITSVFEDLNQYVPEAQQRALAYGGLPSIEKSLIELFSEKGLKFLATPAYDMFVKSMQTSYTSNAKTDIDPVTKKPILNTRVELIQDNSTRIKEYVKLEASKYRLKNKKEPSKEQLRDYRDTIVDIISNEQSFDLGKIVKVYASLVLGHKHKSQLEDTIKVANTIIDSYGEVLRRPDGSVLTNSNNVVQRKDKVNSFPNLKKSLDIHVRNVIYGDVKEEEGKGKKIFTKTEKDKQKELTQLLAQLELEKENGLIEEEMYVSVKNEVTNQLEGLGKVIIGSKVGDNVLKYVQLKLMGWNVLGGISNMGFGYFSNIIEGAGNQLYSGAEINDAYKMVMHSVVKNATFNQIESDVALKIRSGMNKMDILKDASNELNTGSTPSSLNKGIKAYYPYNVNQRTEYLNQAPIMIALAKNTFVDTPKGRVSLWEGFDKNWNWNNEYGVEPKDELIRYRLKVDQLIKRNHGNYDNLSPLALKRTITGRFVSQFRTWLFESVAVRFEKERHDDILDIDVKGRYISAWEQITGDTKLQTTKEFLITLLKQYSFGLLDSSKAFNQLVDGEKVKDVDAANMRRVVKEVYLGLNTYLFLLALSLIAGDDDEDKNKTMNILFNQGTRLKTDLLLYVNPMEARNIVRDIIPATMLVKDSTDWVGSVFGLFTGEDRITSGVHEGDSRFGSASLKMLPFLSKGYGIYNSTTQVFDK